jgi:hypothetical protein
MRSTILETGETHMRIHNFRFSLWTMMAVVSVFAVACAAFRSATETWASAAFTLSLGVLLFAVLAALFRRGESRVFWLGFVCFGVPYLVLTFGPWFAANVRDHLLTSKLLAVAYRRTDALWNGRSVAVGDVDADGWPDLVLARQSETNSLFRAVGNGRFVNVTGQTGFVDLDGDGNLDLFAMGAYSGGRTWASFERIGHSLFAIIVGLVGGLVAVFLWRSSRRAHMAPRPS